MAIDTKTLAFLKENAATHASSMLCLGRQHLDIPGESRGFAENILKRELGLINVESLDVSPEESPDYIMDLGKPIRRPKEYDIVLDGGTIEHVFDPLQALDNAANMTAIGGMFVSVQLLNFSGHGFWQLSPELMFKWSSSRGFANPVCEINRLGPFSRTKRIHYNGKRIELSSVVPLVMRFAATKNSNNIQDDPSQCGPSSSTSKIGFWLNEVRVWSK